MYRLCISVLSTLLCTTRKTKEWHAKSLCISLFLFPVWTVRFKLDVCHQVLHHERLYNWTADLWIVHRSDAVKVVVTEQISQIWINYSLNNKFMVTQRPEKIQISNKKVRKKWKWNPDRGTRLSHTSRFLHQCFSTFMARHPLKRSNPSLWPDVTNSTKRFLFYY